MLPLSRMPPVILGTFLVVKLGFTLAEFCLHWLLVSKVSS